LGDQGGTKSYGRVDLPLGERLGAQLPYIGSIENALIMRARNVVCTTCNNGWMSRLQDETIPILGPTIDGQTIDISPSQQATAGTWAVMTAIMSEYAHGQTVEEFRRQYFYEHKSPPPNTLVLLLRLDDPPTTTAYWALRRRGKEHPENVYHYLVFLGIRELGILVIQGLLEHWQSAILDSRPRNLVRLWAPILAPRRWPPPAALSINATLALSYEVMGHSPNPSVTALQVEPGFGKRRPKVTIKPETDGQT
jgi:hypothetical protein